MIWTTHLTSCFLGPTRVHNPNAISISSAVFTQLTADRVSSGTSGHAISTLIRSLIPNWVHSTEYPKRHLNQFSRFCRAHGRASLYFIMVGPPFLPKTAPSYGTSWPHLILGSFSAPEPTTQTASRSVQPFLQNTRPWQTDRQTDRQTKLIGQ